MKFRIERDELLKGLECVGNFIPRKATSELLGNIFISAHDGIVEFSGTDLNVFTKRIIKEDINVLEDGKALVPFRLVYDILRKVPEGEQIVVEKDKNSVKFNASNFNFDCSSINPEDESVFIGPEVSGDPLAVIPAKDFIDAINKVKDAAVNDTNTSRPILLSILIERKNNVINFVALDGFRISWATIENEGKDFSIKVDGKILQNICRAIDIEKEVKIFASKNVAIFEQENLVCKTPLFDGDFISYEKVFCSIGNNVKIEVLKEDLIAAIERAMIVASDTHNNTIKLRIKDDEITILADTETAKLEDKVSVSKEGADLKIAFNAKFLLDALKYQPEKIIIFSNSSSTSGWVIEGEEEHGYKSFVLPVKIKGYENEDEYVEQKAS